MPIARFELPDGRIARFEVPEGTTPAQAQQMMSSQADSIPTPQAFNPAQQKFTTDPVMRTPVTTAPDIPATSGVLKGERADEPSVGLQRAMVPLDAATFGTADEISGLMARLTGDDYEEQRKFFDKGTEAAYRDRPKESITLGLLGGLSTGGTIASMAKNAAPKTAQALATLAKTSPFKAGLITGGTYGGLYGAGSEEEDRLTGAATGAMYGAPTGGLLAKATSVIAPKVASMLGKKPTQPTGLLSEAERGASKKVGDVIKKTRRFAQGKYGEATGMLTEATERGVNTFINGERVPALQSGISELSKTITDPQGRSIIANSIRALRKMGAKGEYNLNELMGIRRGLQSGTYAERQIKNLIDDTIEKSIAKGNIRGDKEAGKLWQQGNSLYRQYMEKFENQPFIHKIVKGVATDEEIAADLLGSGSVGTARKAGQRFNELTNIFGDRIKPDLKKAVVGRIFDFSRRNIDGADDLIWMQRTAKELKNLRNENKTLWNKFSPDEKQLLQTFEENVGSAARPGITQKALGALQNIKNNIWGGQYRLPVTVEKQALAPVEDVLRIGTKPRIGKALGQDFPRAKDALKATGGLLKSQKGALEVGKKSGLLGKQSSLKLGDDDIFNAISKDIGGEVSDVSNYLGDKSAVLRNKNVAVQLGINETGDSILLSNIAIKDLGDLTKRVTGQGHGSEVLSSMKAYSNKTGKPIIAQGATSQRAENFYKKAGFVKHPDMPIKLFGGGMGTSKNNYIYNPIKKSGLLGKQDKLPMDKASRMQRAREMGFDVDNPVYHGTGKVFDSFDNKKARQGEKASFFSEDAETANFFAKARGGNPNVIKAWIRGNMKNIDAKGKRYTEGGMKKAISLAKKEGFDGIKFTNLDDIYEGTQHVVFDPKNIRSTHAKFDPKMSKSGNILAGTAAGGLLVNEK